MNLTFPHSKNLPLELVNEVLNHCQREDLFAIALTNSDYRIEAERVLYGSITLNIETSYSKRVCCLKTLAKIQSKANMVKSFELICMDRRQLSPSQLDWLGGSLVAMRSLKHLKLNFANYQHRRDLLLLLAPALKSCTFSLATIYIPPFLLDDWILNQNQLKVFEMHDFLSFTLEDRQSSICKQLSTQNSFPLTIFIIVPLETIAAFPIFSVNARWSAKDIADSLIWETAHRRRAGRAQTMTTRPKAHGVVYFKLHLDSLSDEGTVHDILTSLSEHFPYLKSIIFVINDSEMRLHPSSFSSLHKFLHLESIDIDDYSDYIGIEYYSNHYSGLNKLTHPLSHENYLGLARSWATNCPKLCKITFPDGRTAHRVESGHWI